MPKGGRLTSALLAVALTLEIAMVGLALAPTAQAQAPGNVSPEAYHTYDEMKADMQSLAEEHDVAEFRVLGQSTLGQEIFAVDVAQNISDRSEEELAALPTLYVDGAHHGNEILSAEAAYYFLTRVLANATEDARYLEGKRLVVNPIVNPDGYTRDQRENTNGVDLNRNYPFHWGLYGTSDAPFTGNYRGEEAASEVETQTNIDTMEGLNLYAFLTGHTGTYDIVLPWRQSEDGEIPDWPLYEKTLGEIENETGLEYRDPSGAGEAHAWAYGNRTALGLLPEVDTEQTAPASTQAVEQRLNEVLQVYRITWENLTHLGGSLHLTNTTDGNLTLHNDGWGPAYNVTLGTGADVAAPDANTSANASANATNATPRIAEIPAGGTATLPIVDGAEAVTYERVKIDGDDPSLKLKTLALPAGLNASQDAPPADDGFLSVPAPGLAALVSLLGTLALARRPRG